MANAIDLKNPQVPAKKEKKDSIGTLIDAYKDKFAKALPATITPERFARIATTAIAANPSLAKCSQTSLIGALLQSASVGLEPNSPLGQAYLIPYNGECQFQISYKGIIELAHRSGQLKSIEAHCVHENDLFEYELGLEPKLKHIPAKTNRGSVIWVYAIYHLNTGGYGFEVMSREDINAHRKRYSKARTSPWDSAWEEMAKKGLALDTKIPTPNGWTTMGEIQKGDFVFDMYGNPTEVIAVSEVKNLPCYNVTFSDGTSIVCDDEHRWVAALGKNAARNVEKSGWETLTVNELYEAKENGTAVTVPVTPCIMTCAKELPVEPWVLGYWLGNGSHRTGSVACDIHDVEYVKNRLSTAYPVGSIRKDKRSNGTQIGIHNLKEDLKTAGVLMNKHIPEIYMRASTEQRKELLKGLLDSDGCAEKTRGRAIFNSTNRKLAKGVLEIALSLGEMAHMTAREAKGFGRTVICYTVEWTPAGFNPFGMPRKAEIVGERTLKPYRSVKSIEKIDSVPTRCIAVGAESKTYLAGDSMVPTHNTVIKKVLKYAPMSSEFVRATAADEHTLTVDLSSDFDEPTINEDYIVDAEYTVDEDGVINETE